MGFDTKNITETRENEKRLSLVWSTKKVNYILDQINNGDEVRFTPFYKGDIEWRDANISFEYTTEELEILKRCSNDIIFFANNFCKVMTDDGIQNITLRDYQEGILQSYQHNRFIALLASRQIGKTITTAIFFAWYVCFHYDKNALIIANKAKTTEEIIDKLKVILKNLPFFMQPGIITNNVMSMKFDNGCRVIGQATTKTAAIGFTLHLVYMDEFAHIPANFIEPFYRSVYPTISSSKISKLIISSTPNGTNLFYEIYNNAILGKNEYLPIRIDWYDVPGRDENWVKQTIANLGSEAMFNQEYGNQFLSAEKMFLNGLLAKKVTNNKTEYVYREIEDLENLIENPLDFKFHPKVNMDTLKDYYHVISIDLGDGGGGDYSVFNIFRLSELPSKKILSMESSSKLDDYFNLIQIASFSNNNMEVQALRPFFKWMVFELLDAEKTKVVLEVNFKADLLIEDIEEDERYFDDIFHKSKHTKDSKIEKIGVKLTPYSKPRINAESKEFIKKGIIIPTKSKTILELTNLSKNSNGSYSSQTGNDDEAMTVLNLASLFIEDDFYYMCESYWEILPEHIRKEITMKMDKEENEKERNDIFDYLRTVM